MIFDTHAHYDDEAFEQDRTVLLEGMKERGVGLIVNVGASLSSSKESLALAERYPFVYAAVGVHPNETAELSAGKMSCLRELAENEKVVAVGEIGLDYYWDEPGREIQKEWFAKQLDLAREVKLPVIIHSREAAKDTYEIMTENHAEEIGGVVHCFSYSPEMAENYIKMGFYIGIGGVLTFPNARRLKEVAEAVPLDRIVLETDSPYLSPVPFRGKRNQSDHLTYVVEALAEIKKISAEEIIEKTRQNGLALYRIQQTEILP